MIQSVVEENDMAELIGPTQQPQSMWDWLKSQLASATGANVPYRYANPATSPMDSRVTIGPSPEQTQMRADGPSMGPGTDPVVQNMAFWNAILGHITDLGMAGTGALAAGAVVRKPRVGPNAVQPVEPVRRVEERAPEQREARPWLEQAVRDQYRKSEDLSLKPGENPILASRPRQMERRLRKLPGQTGPVTSQSQVEAAGTPAPNPRNVTPTENAELMRVANDYTRKNGLPDVKHEPFTVNEDLSRRIGQHYDATENNENDPAVRAAYKKFTDETEAQYQHLIDAGYKMIKTDNPAPYLNLADMQKDIANKQLKVWTGGSPEHALITPDQNIKFRFVHDIMGHGLPGANAGHGGEELAYRSHVQMYTPEAQKAMATEARGQNTALHFGPKQNNPPHTMYTPEFGGDTYGQLKFPQQKAMIMPEEFRHPEGKVEVRQPATNALLAKDYTKPVQAEHIMRSGFIDQNGQGIQINGDHWEALYQAKLTGEHKDNGGLMQDGKLWHPMPEVLAKNGLARIHVIKNSYVPSLTVEIAGKPSDKMVEAVNRLSAANPKAVIVYDLYDAKGTRLPTEGNTIQDFNAAVKKNWGGKK